jgi:hypothetical protein|tara:strand:- start:1517 stop:2128 length:612 start_codon:yes stop_codon:yes gene_type:complete
MQNVSVKSLTISDEVAISANYWVTVARPTAACTLAATELASTHNSGARNISITTLANESTITLTVVGTGLDGVASGTTEVITLPASATTESATTLFSAIASMTVSAQPSANISVGFGDSCGQQVFAGRTVLRGLIMISGGAAGDVSFRNTSESGTSLFDYRTLGTENSPSHMTIPDNGVKFLSGLFVTYTLDVANQITQFYDG